MQEPCYLQYNNPFSMVTTPKELTTGHIVKTPQGKGKIIDASNNDIFKVLLPTGIVVEIKKCTAVHIKSDKKIEEILRIDKEIAEILDIYKDYLEEKQLDEFKKLLDWDLINWDLPKKWDLKNGDLKKVIENIKGLPPFFINNKTKTEDYKAIEYLADIFWEHRNKLGNNKLIFKLYKIIIQIINDKPISYELNENSLKPEGMIDLTTVGFNYGA